MTQCELILRYMEEFGSITPMVAFEMGITRLAARISDLKADGYKIKTNKVRYTAKDGKKKTYARYSLEEDA